MATKPKAASVAGPAPVAAEFVVPAVADAVAAAAIEVAPVPEPAAEPLKEEVAQVAAEIEPTTAHVNQSMEKVVKSTEDFVAFGQGNVDAFVKSSQIWTAGVQDLSKQVAASAQAQFDETVSVFKAMTGMKSLKDMFELQSSFAKAALEKSMTESSKLTDASMKLTEQALAPIAARMTTAVETFGKAA